jgi:hypothetical protein
MTQPIGLLQDLYRACVKDHYRVQWVDSDDGPANTYERGHGPSCRCRKLAMDCDILLLLEQIDKAEERHEQIPI